MDKIVEKQLTKTLNDLKEMELEDEQVDQELDERWARRHGAQNGANAKYSAKADQEEDAEAQEALRASRSAPISARNGAITINGASDDNDEENEYLVHKMAQKTPRGGTTRGRGRARGRGRKR